ncbi:hypothetical protein SDJN03_26222, partial [Cucurbita argyrosperma subsp. sororia]
MEMKRIIIKQFKNSTAKQVGKGKKTPNRSSEATVIYDRDSTAESHDGVRFIFSAEFSNGRLGFRSRISPTYIVCSSGSSFDNVVDYWTIFHQILTMHRDLSESCNRNFSEKKYCLEFY